MSIALLIRLYLVFIGAVLFIANIISLSQKKMSESYSLIWLFLSIILFLLGIFIDPININNYISLYGLISLMIINTIVIYIAWFITTTISLLTRQNRELAMQISLLNEESVKIHKVLEKFKKKAGND